MKCLHFPNFKRFFKNRNNNSYSVRLIFLSSYTAIINVINTAVIDQFIALKKQNQSTEVLKCGSLF